MAVNKQNIVILSYHSYTLQTTSTVPNYIVFLYYLTLFFVGISALNLSNFLIHKAIFLQPPNILSSLLFAASYTSVECSLFSTYFNAISSIYMLFTLDQLAFWCNRRHQPAYLKDFICCFVLELIQFLSTSLNHFQIVRFT